MRLISKTMFRSAEAINALRSVIDKACSFINSFVVVMLTPEEIAAYTKRIYDKETSPFGDQEYIESGLNLSEREVIGKHAGKCGSLLVLGCGGGRESIALAKMGFAVTGIDFSEKLVRKAKEQASRSGVHIDVLEGDFLEMTLPKGGFDCCLLTSFMYSAIPSRAMRVKLLSHIKEILTGRGITIIHFLTARRGRSERLFIVRKAIARVFKGNTSYQMGDGLYPPGHFYREFLDEPEVIDEVREADLVVKEIISDALCPAGMYAILEKTGER